jgi:hypothetical protein
MYGDFRSRGSPEGCTGPNTDSGNIQYELVAANRKTDYMERKVEPGILSQQDAFNA